jgi:hypothetical protein
MRSALAAHGPDVCPAGALAMTVQRALAILKEEGLIYSVPGRGTFVK